MSDFEYADCENAEIVKKNLSLSKPLKNYKKKLINSKKICQIFKVLLL